MQIPRSSPVGFGRQSLPRAAAMLRRLFGNDFRAVLVMGPGR